MQHPFTGVSSLGLDVEAIVDACHAYEPLLRDGEAFSHQTAALLFGAPLPARLRSVVPLHVMSPGVTRARTNGTIGHRSAGGFPVVLRFGLPVVSPEATWLHLAGSLSREDLTAVGDFLVTGARFGRGREPGLTTARSWPPRWTGLHAVGVHVLRDGRSSRSGWGRHPGWRRCYDW